MKPTLRTTGTTLAAAAVLVTALAASTPQAHAGRDEWATAGKILTGVVVAKVLTDHLDRDDDYKKVTVRETRVIRRTTHGGTVRTGHYGRGRSHHQKLQNHRRGYRHPRQYQRPRGYRNHYRRDNNCHSGFDRGRIIVEINTYRRLVQPRVHGHPAFIQRRPYVGHPWITVRKHPSIY